MNHLTRRAFLGRSASGLGALALESLLKPDLLASGGLPGLPNFAPKARRIIFLFMAGGPSHVDLFDPKPKLNELEGQTIPPELLNNHQQFALIRGTPKLQGSPYTFQKHGQSGTVISELLPHLSRVADELTVIRSMHTDSNVHDPAVNFMNCGTLLEDTLVIWGGEFGRTPVAQVAGKTWGRDHHPHGFTMWLAAGGMKPGITYGATDDFGYHTTENPVHVHDLHATILHQMGIHHERLTFRTQGRDFRLTDVAGKVVCSILA
jgi:hypothetical protein